ncbi:MAG: SprB repeat-containing protein, partial [Bacteroidota bacterium]|nr:SprB repeat-containing protein [Bacteroidota bacterium]
VTIECTGSPAFTDPVVTDQCDPNVTISFTDNSNLDGCGEGTITRTWTATDCAGNAAPTVSQTITIEDTTPPVLINEGADLTIECTGTPIFTDPSVTDNCDANVVISFDDVISIDACGEGTITRTWTAIDCAGNVAIPVSQIITIEDTMPPVLSGQGSDVTVNCPETAVFIDPLVNDDCDPNVIISFTDLTNLDACGTGTIARTWIASDCAGNAATPVTQIFTIDLLPLTLITSTNETVDCYDEIVVPAPPVIMDPCGNEILPTGPQEGIIPACEGDVTYTWTYVDCSGNTQLYVHTATIEYEPFPSIPSTSDVVDCYANIILPAPPDVIDNCGNALIPSAPIESGIISCESEITYTWTYTDCEGNIQTYEHFVTINDDILPTASDPADINLAGCNTAVPAPDASVVTDEADNCGNANVAFDNDLVSMTGCIETTIRTYRVFDDCGNEIFVSHTITRTVDTTPPVFDPIPQDVTINCDDVVPPMIALDFTDNCSPGGTVTGTQSGPSGDPLTITREWTITDDCGNATTVIQLIILENELIPNTINESICNGNSVFIYGVEYTTGGIYQDTIESTTGECDTALVINIQEITGGTLDIQESVCPGDSSIIFGETYGPGVYSITLPGINGECDTLVNINVSGLPYNFVSINETICAGETIIIDGIEFDAAGTFIDTLQGVSPACDTIRTITIAVTPLILNSISASICPEGSVTLYGVEYDMPGIYIDTILNSTGGCDTALTITILQLDYNMDQVNESICQGESVVIFGEVYNSAGVFLDTIAGTGGACDTIFTITISIIPNLFDTASASFCEGESVIVFGETYDTPGIFQDTLISTTGGCDTIVTITITEIPNIEAEITPQDQLCTFSGSVTLSAIPPAGVWSGAVSNNQFDPAALGVGNHQVIYTIPGSCGSADTISISVYEMEISCLTIQHETSIGAGDGQGQVTISGGISPYTISWSGPESGNGSLPADGDFIISNLSPGTYTIVVTDDSGCSTTCQFTIDPAPCDMVIDVDVIDATCSGAANGAISITPSGGNPVYQYSLDGINYQLSNVFSSLTSGLYTVYVRDANGCIKTRTIQINAGQGPVLQVEVIINATCGELNGSVEVTS